MHAHKIIKVDVLDILFAGRNKEYGAYDLRKTYYKRISLALIITIVTISGLFIASVISNRFSERHAVSMIQVRDISLAELRKLMSPHRPRRPSQS